MTWQLGPACGVDCSSKSTLQASRGALPARYLPSVLSLITSKKSHSWSEWFRQRWQWGHIQPFLTILGSVWRQTLLSALDKVLRLEGLLWAGVVWALKIAACSSCLILELYVFAWRFCDRVWLSLVAQCPDRAPCLIWTAGAGCLNVSVTETGKTLRMLSVWVSFCCKPWLKQKPKQFMAKYETLTHKMELEMLKNLFVVFQ